MAPILKSLTILLATATIICGGKIKKSEKRGIADFGSGFSTSRLEGSGIKISTDFGKEITLEEFKQNGYNFGNNNNAELRKDLGGSLNFGQDLGNNKFELGGDFGKNFENNFNFAAAQQSLGSYGNQGGQGVEGTQGIQSGQDETNNGNSGADASQSNQGNNGESSSVSYITQRVPVPVPQPYQVTVNHPVPVSVPQRVPINVPRLVSIPVPQPYPVHIIKPYPVTVNRPVPVPIPHPVPVPQRQEFPGSVPQPYPVSVAQPVTARPANQLDNGGGAYNQGQNFEAAGSQGQSLSGDEQKYLGNAIQNEASSYNSVSGNHDFNQIAQSNQISNQLPASNANQFVSHESESTANNGFVPSSYSAHSVGLQQGLQSTGHQSGFPQELQSSVGSQGFQPGGDHSAFSHLSQGSQSSLADLQRGLQSSGHQSGYPQGLPSQAQSVFASIQQGLQAGHSSFGGQQQGGLQQGLQSVEGHSPFAGFQQGFQSGHSSSAGLQQGLQSIGGHSSLTGLQQGFQSALSGLSHGMESSGSFNQLQAAASQPKFSGYSVSVGNEQGQQALGHIQQSLGNTGGHGYSVESNTYGAKM